MRRLLSAASWLVLTCCASAAAKPERAGTPSWERRVAERIAAFDRDGSGRIEASEVAGIPCPFWQDVESDLLESARVGLAVRYGLRPGMLFLGDVLGLAVSAREAIVSHLEACVGTTPPPNGASLAAAIHSLDVTPASHLWDAAVAEMLRIHFDSDGSGRIDRDLEVLDIPCEVFVALEEAVSTTTNAPFSAVYGFAYGFEWVGASLGFSETVREETRRALDQCQLP